MIVCQTVVILCTYVVLWAGGLDYRNKLCYVICHFAGFIVLQLKFVFPDLWFDVGVNSYIHFQMVS